MMVAAQFLIVKNWKQTTKKNKVDLYILTQKVFQDTASEKIKLQK